MTCINCSKILAGSLEASATRDGEPYQKADKFDWAMLFRQAGLDIGCFTPCEAISTPQIATDMRFAWSGPSPDEAGIEVYVEAAAFRRRPVYFRRFRSWDATPGATTTSDKYDVGTHALEALFLLLRIGAIVGSVLFARRNLRLGRGDRRGATHLALCVFVIVSVQRR